MQGKKTDNRVLIDAFVRSMSKKFSLVGSLLFLIFLLSSENGYGQEKNKQGDSAPLFIQKKEKSLEIILEDSLPIQENPSQDSMGKGSFEQEKKIQDILLFGIDSDVLPVLNTLQEEKNPSYNKIIHALIQETHNEEIIQAIILLWEQTDYQEGIFLIEKELDKVLMDQDYEIKTVLSAINFLSNKKVTQAGDKLYQIANNQNIDLSVAAIQALGKLEDSSGADSLLKQLKEADPVAEEKLVSALIVSLGQMRSQEAADTLIFIVEDSSSSSGHRRLAAFSLGLIAREEDYAVIERLYYETDEALLRSYALAGLAEFPDKDSTALFIQALKRDNYWRIRLIAVEKLADYLVPEVVKLLIYKAENDPIIQVRVAALKSLASFGTEESQDFLRTYYSDQSNDTKGRLAALSFLLENKTPGTIEILTDMMDILWEKDKNRFLEFSCRDLSQIQWGELAPLYKRMLNHPYWIIQVYGIRGIIHNDLTPLLEDVKNLDPSFVHEQVRRELEIISNR